MALDFVAGCLGGKAHAVTAYRGRAWAYSRQRWIADCSISGSILQPCGVDSDIYAESKNILAINEFLAQR